MDPTRVLYRSQTIPGVLMQDMNSDLPGQVKIMVTRPVLDRFGQGQVLIPQYTMLVGQQDGRPVYGQARLGVTLEEMELPDGTVLGLGKAALADKSGAMGVAGKVNNHWGKVGLGVEHEHATCSGWLEREDPEWERAWSHFPDPVMAHPASGECLQYLGSAQYPGRGWVHIFRHRQVPGSDQRQYWRVAASAGWRPVQQRGA